MSPAQPTVLAIAAQSFRVIAGGMALFKL